MMRNIKHAIALLLCSSITLSFPCFVQAQDTQGTNAEKPQIDFQKLESYGLLDTVEAGSLGQELYSGSYRNTLSSLITKIQTHSDLIGLEKLTNHMLLTSANAGEIKNDIEISEGGDMMTLRLETMLERGMNIQAFELVSKLDEDLLYHPRLSKAAIISMLFSGEKGSACLEINATKDRFQEDAFWKTLNAYCSITLSDTPSETAKKTISESKYPIIKNILSSPDYKFSYTPDSYSKLSLVEKAVLVAEDRITFNNLNKDNVKSIPSSHLQALIKIKANTSQELILLTAQAVITGALPPEALAEEFMLVNQALALEKRQPKGMEELAPLIKKVKGTWHIDDPDTALAKSITYSKEYNPAFIIPFIEAYEGKSSLDQFSFEQISMIIRAFIISDTHIPKGWYDNILARPTATDDEAFVKTKLIMATALLSPDKTLNQFKTDKYKTNFTKDRTNKLISYKNIIENIDNTADQYAKVRYIYENNFDSTSNKSYMMPPYFVSSELENAAHKNSMAEVVGLCNLVSAGSLGKSIYPGLVAEMFKNLTAVGLSKPAKEIVAQAILDIE